VRAPGHGAIKSGLAAVLSLVSLLLVAGAFSLLAAAKAEAIGYDYFHLQDAAVGVSFPILGWLIIRRLGSHPVGWILVLSGLSGALGVFAEEYVTYGYEFRPDSLPAVEFVGWVGSWTWLFFFTLMPVLLLVFPNGKALSPRWRPLVWVALALNVLVPAMLAAVSWGQPLEEFADATGGEPPDDLEAVFGVAVLLVFLLLVAGLASLILRWRRSGDIEREQIKTFLFFAAFGVAALVVSQITGPLSESAGVLAFVVFPAGIAVAILRYRLYDIDRIISRTVSYVLVLVVLGLVVLGLVALFAVFLPSDDPLVVAISTLAAAALFNPVRRRVQALIDRRFNRSRYDAQRVIGRFTASLQEQVDPDEVVDGWMEVVEDTMQPEGVGVWVREE